MCTQLIEKQGHNVKNKVDKIIYATWISLWQNHNQSRIASKESIVRPLSAHEPNNSM